MHLNYAVVSIDSHRQANSDLLFTMAFGHMTIVPMHCAIVICGRCDRMRWRHTDWLSWLTHGLEPTCKHSRTHTHTIHTNARHFNLAIDHFSNDCSAGCLHRRQQQPMRDQLHSEICPTITNLKNLCISQSVWLSQKYMKYTLGGCTQN